MCGRDKASIWEKERAGEESLKRGRLWRLLLLCYTGKKKKHEVDDEDDGDVDDGA